MTICRNWVVEKYVGRTRFKIYRRTVDDSGTCISNSHPKASESLSIDSWIDWRVRIVGSAYVRNQLICRVVRSLRNVAVFEFSSKHAREASRVSNATRGAGPRGLWYAEPRLSSRETRVYAFLW